MLEDILKLVISISKTIESFSPISKQFISAAIWFVLFSFILMVIKRKFKKIGFDKLHIKFFYYILLSIVMIIQMYLVFTSLFPSIRTFLDGLMINTSLLVVVAGFATQESIGNIIHGLCISIFKPFQKDDRVKINNIAGIVEDITLRHTIIRTYTNTRLIIPNTEADKAILENTPVTSEKTANFIDVYLAHGCDVEFAIELIREAAEIHPAIIDTRDEIAKQNNFPIVTVILRELAPYYIVIRATIWTKTVDENFRACGDIRVAIQKSLLANNIPTPKSIDISALK